MKLKTGRQVLIVVVGQTVVRPILTLKDCIEAALCLGSGIELIMWKKQIVVKALKMSKVTVWKKTGHQALISNTISFAVHFISFPVYF